MMIKLEKKDLPTQPCVFQAAAMLHVYRTLLVICGSAPLVACIAPVFWNTLVILLDYFIGTPGYAIFFLLQTTIITMTSYYTIYRATKNYDSYFATVRTILPTIAWIISLWMMRTVIVPLLQFPQWNLPFNIPSTCSRFGWYQIARLVIASSLLTLLVVLRYVGNKSISTYGCTNAPHSQSDI
jgi:hypothetical protein